MYRKLYSVCCIGVSTNIQVQLHTVSFLLLVGIISEEFWAYCRPLVHVMTFLIEGFGLVGGGDGRLESKKRTT